MKLPDWLIPGAIGEHWDNPHPHFLEALIEAVVRDCAKTAEEHFKACVEDSILPTDSAEAILARYGLEPK